MNFAPSPSVDWRFGGLVPTGNPMALSKGSTSMVVESFGPTLWNQSQTIHSQNLGGLFCDINNNVQNSTSTSDLRNGLTSIDYKTFDMGWNPAAISSSQVRRVAARVKGGEEEARWGRWEVAGGGGEWQWLGEGGFENGDFGLSKNKREWGL
ncbi:transcription factor bHLH49-like [Fagus crenata]